MESVLTPIAFVAMAAAAPSAHAGSTIIDQDQLRVDTVLDHGKRALLAADSAGQPLSFLLRIPKGVVLLPHGAQGGVRLLTILSGDLF